MVDPVHLARPAPGGRRLLVRLCLFAFCGGLLLLLSSRPADAAERREPGLLDPVGTTLKATAREVDSFAGRATGSRSSAVGGVADAARKALAPPSRPSAGVARPAPVPAVRRGAPAVTSPVRRAAPPTRPAALVRRAAPLDRVARLAAALTPVASALAPVLGPVAGLVPPVVPGGLLPPPGSAGAGERAAESRARRLVASFAGFDAAGSTSAWSAFQMSPARPAADGASSPAARSWPALTGAVGLPGVPASAELPAGGPDPLSSSAGAGSILAALAAALLLLGLSGRGITRPDRSGVISRSYLPLVSPA